MPVFSPCGEKALLHVSGVLPASSVMPATALPDVTGQANPAGSSVGAPPSFAATASDTASFDYGFGDATLDGTVDEGHTEMTKGTWGESEQQAHFPASFLSLSVCACVCSH